MSFYFATIFVEIVSSALKDIIPPPESLVLQTAHLRRSKVVIIVSAFSTIRHSRNERCQVCDLFFQRDAVDFVYRKMSPFRDHGP